MAMVNMKRDAQERKESQAIEYEEPAYPYGLCISLGKDELEKLGMRALPAVGTEVMVMAKGFIKSASSSEYQGEGKHMDVQVQLTDLELGQSSASSNAANALYGA